MQPKLLRVLQEQEFERVGGSQPVRVNVRILSATNRDLAKAVAAGRFRADLFYRLAVFPIEVPPLRARPDDCAVLARAFVEEQAHRLGKHLDGIDPRALERLVAHDWPGNVRELANVVERAAIVAAGATLTERDLPPLARTDAGDAGERDEPGRPLRPLEDEPDPRLESVERAHVTRILERAGWVIEGRKGAAAVLGLAPSTLRSRMAQLAIRRAKR